MGFFTLILSVVGELNQTCWDEQFDMKIIPICSADRERLRINRFRRFCGFGLDFGKGVNFLCFWRVVWGGGWRGWIFCGSVHRAGWIFQRWDFDRLCGMLWESETLSEKAFCFCFVYEFVFFAIIISSFGKMRRSLRLEAKNEKLLNVKKNVAVNIIACPIVKKTKKN